VPLIVRCPGRIKAGIVSDHICAHWDIMPTIADFAGVKPPRDLDGISFNSTISSEPGSGEQRQHDFLYWEFHERGFQQAARMGKWKGVLLKHGVPLELYDLESDIGEEHNVAAEHPEIVGKIADDMKGARSENADWPIPPERSGKSKNKT
jgi:arylsulfatase A